MERLFGNFFKQKVIDSCDRRRVEHQIGVFLTNSDSYLGTNPIISTK